MLNKIISFELKYRLHRPATYIYFFILFFMTFLCITTDAVIIGGAAGKVLKNSPYTIDQIVSILMIFGAMICSAVMGIPVFRDFDYKFHEIIFTTPVKKWQYLGGRFIGSYIITVIIFLAVPLAIMLGSIMPWIDKETIGPFMIKSYLSPFILFIIPNTLFMGIIFFSIGSLFRRQLAIYVQGVAFFILYMIIINYIKDIEHDQIFSILDPFGFASFLNVTKYWTPIEKNTIIIPFTGYILYNRLFWIGISLICAAVFYKLFSFSKYGLQLKSKIKSHVEEYDKPETINRDLPKVHIDFNINAAIKQFIFLLRFNFKLIIRGIPFLVITFCGISFLLINSKYIGSMYGTSCLPVTYMIIEMLTGNFIIFLIIITTFYSGELIWKEIDVRIAPITDASPIKSFQILAPKFVAMLLAEVFLLLLLIITGVFIQAVNGFYDFQLPVYFKFIGLNIIPTLFLITLLIFFIHTLVNNKFLGHAIVIIFYLTDAFLSRNQLGHNMLWYGRAPSASYSAMNGFGHFIFPINVFNAYWLTLGIIFFSLAVLFIKRGTDTIFISRLKEFKNLYVKSSARYIIPVCIIIFILLGTYIYYNTFKLNIYRTDYDNRKIAANYERKYKKYQNRPGLSITYVKVNVDIYPQTRRCNIIGRYILKNKSRIPIDTVRISINENAKINLVDFKNGTKNILSDKNCEYYWYKLNKPVLPGDSTTLTFSLEYFPKGFENNGGSTVIVYNGTFINKGFMPSLGYQEGKEINDDNDRRKEKLPKKVFTMPPIADTPAYNTVYGFHDAGWIKYEATVSTSADQIALSPGELENDWIKDGRHYYHYKAHCPVWNFYSFLSARYEVFKDTFEGVKIEIYCHKGNNYNIQRMDKAIKKTISYCSKNFSPFQNRIIRIAEFPRYELFAQSFPNTIPFSEGMGFIMDIDKVNDIDIPFYVTAHEVAHQWWGHQVMGAYVQGATMTDESLAQYTALMVMEHEYGKANMKKFLKYEMDKYLRGRASEHKRELPLYINEEQGYIHYNKGSLVFYALRDYIGEDKLNKALSEYVHRYEFQEPPYPTTIDMIRYISAFTPDSLKYIIKDLFETITLYNNKVLNVTSKQIADGKYKVDMDLEVVKLRADSLGNEKKISVNDWIDVGVYGKTSKGNDTLIYLDKKLFKQSNQHLEVVVNQKPVKAGIDPLFKLIDRDNTDNVKNL